MDETHEALTPREYAAPPCSVCERLRGGLNYSRVYCTRVEGGHRVRYIKCHHCGNTYKDIR
jgi:hypothetical protein